MEMKREMAKLAAILWVLVVLGGLPAQADMTPIELTVDGLNLDPGPDPKGINYAKNDSYVDEDRIGLITSTVNNVGSVLTIHESGKANPDMVGDPLLVTVTARTHMDIQSGLPAGNELHAGVITLTPGGTGSPSNQGLGVRAFTIGIDPARDDYGKRFDDGGDESFRMEGSTEVSGGVDYQTWQDFVDDHKLNTDGEPKNYPPHVDEDVTFNFNNDLFYVAADSVTVLLTDIKTGKSSTATLFDLALDLKINLVGGTSVVRSYEHLSDDTGVDGVFSLLPGYTDVIQVDFSGDSLGLSSSEFIDNFIIGARDDPVDPEKGTDEHFLINGFTADVELVPVPGAVILGVIGIGFTSWLGRRKFSV